MPTDMRGDRVAVPSRVDRRDDPGFVGFGFAGFSRRNGVTAPRGDHVEEL